MTHRTTIALAALLSLLPALGCVGNTLHNPDPATYLRELPVAHDEARTVDLAVIEFDDQGRFWEPEQLEDTIALIERRNREHPEGVAVITFVHGWKNNADFDRGRGSLADFVRSLEELSAQFDSEFGALPAHVVGVFVGWRGSSNTVPYAMELSFFDRLRAAERVASLNMQEALFTLTQTAKRNPESRSYIYGHSMGGLIVARVMRPALTSIILEDPEFPAIADLIVLLNPAVDGHEASLFIDLLKRRGVRTELRTTDGNPVPDRAGGPLIVSITSEADDATRIAFPVGRMVDTLGQAVRHDHGEGEPSQSQLITHAEGHIDTLVSHRASVVDGELLFERVDGAYNDTPYWVVRTTGDIIPDHSNFTLPPFRRLVRLVQQRSDLFNTETQTWVLSARASQETTPR